MGKPTPKGKEKIMREIISVNHYSESGAIHILEDLTDNGYSGTYKKEGYLEYPNYEDADEIVCGYVGCVTMKEWDKNWKYLDERK